MVMVGRDTPGQSPEQRPPSAAATRVRELLTQTPGRIEDALRFVSTLKPQEQIGGLARIFQQTFNLSEREVAELEEQSERALPAIEKNKSRGSAAMGRANRRLERIPALKPFLKAAVTAPFIFELLYILLNFNHPIAGTNRRMDLPEAGFSGFVNIFETGAAIHTPEIVIDETWQSLWRKDWDKAGEGFHEIGETVLEALADLALHGVEIGTVGFVLLGPAILRRLREETIHGKRALKKPSKFVYLVDRNQDLLFHAFAADNPDNVYPIARSEDTMLSAARNFDTTKPWFVNLDIDGQPYDDSENWHLVRLTRANTTESKGVIGDLGKKTRLVVVANGTASDGLFSADSTSQSRGMKLKELRQACQRIGEVLKENGLGSTEVVPLLVARNGMVSDDRRLGKTMSLREAAANPTMPVVIVDPFEELAEILRSRFKPEAAVDGVIKFGVYGDDDTHRLAKQLAVYMNREGKCKYEYVDDERHLKSSEMPVLIIGRTGRHAKEIANRAIGLLGRMPKEMVVVANDTFIPPLDLPSTTYEEPRRTSKSPKNYDNIVTVPLAEIIRGKLAVVQEELESGKSVKDIKKEFGF